jgi:glycosyltransferase involved in cell wall biosynthesis
MRSLTIGMATYDDFDGVYFTIQSIRLFHKEVLDNIEFIIVDNNPSGKHSDSVKKLCNAISEPIQYISQPEYSSTSVRNKIFSFAKTPYVLCIDCHVLIESGAIKKLIDFYELIYYRDRFCTMIASTFQLILILNGALICGELGKRIKEG